MTETQHPVAPASAQPARSGSSLAAWLIGLCLALGVAIIAAVAVGAVALSFTTVSSVVWHKLTGLGAVTWTPVEAQIVWEFRMPRVLLAAIVGAALSVAGAVLQAMVRNPLADPYIFGISSGASVGAVAVLTLGAAVVGGASLPLSAFIGALGTMLSVYALASKDGRASPIRLILAGVAVSYMLSAITSFLVLRASTPGGGGVSSVLYWLAGSLGGAKWELLGVPALALVISTALLMLRARPLNALLVGDESAASLGVNLERFRLELFVVTSLLVGVAVAVSGAIGFVGLMIPHVTRMLIGSDHRRVLPIAALLRATYLVLVDLLGRTIIAPVELPVGLVTAALGGPVFLWLMRRQARGLA